MAIARVQGPRSGYGASPTTATFLSSPTAGNLMVCFARTGNGGASTNGSIPGWTRATGARCATAVYSGIWYKVAGAGESSDVVLTWTGSTGTFMFIEEWGGFTGTPTLDKVAYSDYTVAVTSKTSGTCDTTTANDELCLAGFSHGAAITSPSWTNSFSLEGYDNPASIITVLVSLVASSTWAAETTQSWTTARVCGGLIATFKGVVTSTWIPQVIMVI